MGVNGCLAMSDRRRGRTHQHLPIRPALGAVHGRHEAQSSSFPADAYAEAAVAQQGQHSSGWPTSYSRGRLTTAACIGSTIGVATSEQWLQLMEQVAPVVNFTVISTPSEDISTVVRLVRARDRDRCSRGRDLLVPGAMWSAPDGRLLVVRPKGIIEAEAEADAAGQRDPRTKEVVTSSGAQYRWSATTSRWIEVNAFLNSECFAQMVSAEARFGVFDAVLNLRADQEWLPGASLKMVAYPSFDYFTSVGQLPALLIPDSDDSAGYNDRFAIMNRQAAPAFFSQHARLKLLQAKEPTRSCDSETLLDRKSVV